jgi:hypothetical protein
VEALSHTILRVILNYSGKRTILLRIVLLFVPRKNLKIRVSVPFLREAK